MEFQSGLHSVVEEKDRVLGGQQFWSHNATLPFDVLGMIFHYVADGYPAHLRSLIFVCRSWNDAVCLHPTLWATIWLDCTLLEIFAPNGALPRQLIKPYIHSCLRWSRTAPLDVAVVLFPDRVNSFAAPGDVPEIWSHLFLLVMDLIGPDGEHGTRWRSFTWRCHREYYISQVLAKLPSSLPALKILRLHGVRFDASHSGMFPRCPQLRIVELYQYEVQPLHNEDCLLVSDLIIATDSLWLALDIKILNHFPNIRCLTLSTILDGRALFLPNFGDPSPIEISLPHLQGLRLGGSLAPQMINCLVAPSLKGLYLDCYTCLKLLPYISLADTVEIIHLTIPSLSGAPTPRRIEKLLNSVPELKQLWVPKWFHDWLEQSDFQLDEDVHVLIE